ncbi:ubiquitin-protein ligase E3A isoform X2 [Frankliniella occidentalis]|uniref:Ubiquitin-protein ligase E3A n=1 Tax=Frankliniella occidentalis TaxID=133901 RepID=A0A9C6TPT3_FRAOC|nr:ubiquitin-protein ligase E3A isoform X2 [Frankliniella occidentalis]
MHESRGRVVVVSHRFSTSGLQSSYGTQPSNKSVSFTEESDTMKRAAAKKLIERYFYQLLDGCGNPNCDNVHCASSGKAKVLTPNQAAAQAIQLFSQEAQLCDTQPSKVARTSESDSEAGSQTTSNVDDISQSSTSHSIPSAIPGHSGLLQSKLSTQHEEKPIPHITEEKLLKILETCKRESSYSLLIRTLGEVFSSADSLFHSFVKRIPESPLEALLDKAPPGDLRLLKKEDVRTLEGDQDKDEDSQEAALREHCAQAALVLGHCSRPVRVDIGIWDTYVDLPSLRRAYAALFEQVPGTTLESVLVNALTTLAASMEITRQFAPASMCEGARLHCFVIILELPVLGQSEYLEVALPAICKEAVKMPLYTQGRLARIWAKHCRGRLKELLVSLQQLITLKVISGTFSRDHSVQDEDAIVAPTKLMKILYYANILAGELDSADLRREDPAALTDDPLLGVGFSGNKTSPLAQYEDPLAKELQINVLDSRKPLIPFTEFYNEPLSEAVEMDKDFAHFKSESDAAHMAHSQCPVAKFSFMWYSFILTPATKTLGLYYDNRIRMYSERRMSIYHSMVGQPVNPFLRLKVRRDHIIDDALVELEMVAMENPKDLKKQLVVEFEGEQGIDEGGVSKEFFQLIVEEIFNPDYGMFTWNQETQTVWFNPTSFESDAQFSLIGVVLGLAIYNNVILDVHFPMVVYKKLMGKRATYYDLEDWNNTLYKGLTQLLDYEGDDIEETFSQTFRVCYQDVFGTVLHHDLKEGGEQIPVNKANRREFVDLYADFLLNKSVEKQFRAFRRGFQMVTDESPLHLLFRPEEIEQLVCGSKNFDFNELEEATEYDGGYTAATTIIQQFWEIVHRMPLESKRKLLQFTTGSDRVPVGGLSKLKLIISRNGPDSDRLPTAHTCFNVLLLPEYESKEKLMDRLEKAINYSKGFGML